VGGRLSAGARHMETAVATPKTLEHIRHQSLLRVLDRSEHALSRSDLPPLKRQEVRSQFEIIRKISGIARPDWGHVESLLNRLISVLDDRAPAVSAPLRDWVNQNTTRYRTVAGKWRVEKSETERGRAEIPKHLGK
jgi:hypothetical protein